MKLFQEKPIVEKYSRAKDFVSEYGIGKGDFIDGRVSRSQ